MTDRLPDDLLQFDDDELRGAGRDRDERMSLLFRKWASLTNVELRELRILSDERRRLERHLGSRRSLRALRRS